MLVSSLILCAALSVLSAGDLEGLRGEIGEISSSGGGVAALISIGAIVLYVSFFEAGLGTIPWMIGNEILPPHMKVCSVTWCW